MFAGVENLQYCEAKFCIRWPQKIPICTMHGKLAGSVRGRRAIPIMTDNRKWRPAAETGNSYISNYKK